MNLHTTNVVALAIFACSGIIAHALSSDSNVQMRSLGSTRQVVNVFKEDDFNKEIDLTIGDSVKFRVKRGFRLYEFPDETSYDECNFSGATKLRRKDNVINPKESGTRYFGVKKRRGGTEHCKKGMRATIVVEVSTTPNFTRSRLFMDDLCSSGGAECEQECEPVGCCNPFDEDNCLAENLGGCVSYAKCQALGSDVDPAPLNLPEICSVENIIIDETPCVEACTPVECCHTKDTFESCQGTKMLMCLDYEPCQNLRDDSVISPAPENLDEICLLGILTQNSEECDEICETASCCVALPGSDEENCLQSDLTNCITYSSCALWTLDIDTSIVPPAPSNLKEVCSIGNLVASPGREECADLCEPASCCLEKDDDNCFARDPFGCGEYLRCALLTITGGDLPQAPDNIEDVCDYDNVLTMAGHDECEEMCRLAACCTTDGESNCLDDGDALACAGYLPCLTLLLTDGDIPLPPDDINDYCKFWSMNDEEKEKCEEKCKESECCRAEESNCFFGNVVPCLKWAPCVFL